jgi:hypothetical protein
LGGIAQVTLVDNVITSEDLGRLMAGDLHNHRLGNTFPSHIPDASPSKIVKVIPAISCPATGIVPGFAEVFDGLAVTVEDLGDNSSLLTLQGCGLFTLLTYYFP